MKSLKAIVLALFLACTLPAQAVEFHKGVPTACTVSDAWHGPDKTKHVIGGLAIGSSVTFVTKEPLYGLGATIAVAAAKEAFDRRGYGTCSFQDFAVTVAAGAAGAYGAQWLMLPKTYTTTFDGRQIKDSGVEFYYFKKF